jgi:parallel beta-helix repeat protein
VFDGSNGPSQAGRNIDNGTHDWIFQNLDVQRWHYNGFLVGNSISHPGNAINITIRNCKIHDQIGQDVVGFRYYGIYWGLCDNCTIEGNDIYNNPGGGMQVYPGPSSNLVIRNNKFHHNNHLSSSSVGGILVYEDGTISNLRIYNNLIYSNGSPSSGNATGIELNSGVMGVKIWNNTIYGNKSYGIFAAPGTGSHQISNNNVYLNGLGDILNQGTGDTVSHNLTTNPGFVNAAAFNFSLLTNSPAIDAGVTLSEVTTDFNKSPRPQGGAYDIGAYEVGTGSAIAAPQNLRVN